MKITVKPIGIARNQERQHFGGWDKTVTDLIIDDKFVLIDRIL